MDHSPPGSSVHGIFQARILERVAISSCRRSSRLRDRTRVSCISCIIRGTLCHGATWEAPGKLYIFSKYLLSGWVNENASTGKPMEQFQLEANLSLNQGLYTETVAGQTLGRGGDWGTPDSPSRWKMTGPSAPVKRGLLLSDCWCFQEKPEMHIVCVCVCNLMVFKYWLLTPIQNIKPLAGQQSLDAGQRLSESSPFVTSHWKPQKWS